MMQDSIWDIIASTPWWFYVFGIYLCMVGYKSTQPRIIPINNILIIPLIFMAFFLITLSFNVLVTIPNVLICSLTFVLFIPLGWLHFALFKIKAIPNTTHLYVPGNWSLLIIFAIMLFVKFYYGYHYTFNPAAFKQPRYAGMLMGLYGAFLGLFLGRILYAQRLFRSGPYHIVEIKSASH